MGWPLIMNVVCVTDLFIHLVTEYLVMFFLLIPYKFITLQVVTLIEIWILEIMLLIPSLMAGCNSATIVFVIWW